MDLQQAIADILEAAVQSGQELGCQCAVWQDGEFVADYAAGWCDVERSVPVTPSTMFAVFSAGKAVLSAAALRLIGQGALSLGTRLSELWPEFVGFGKEETTLAQVLNHTTGLFCLPHVDAPSELVDWTLMCSRLAAMKPAWRPGTRTKYQAFTYSWLLGEPLSRCLGVPIDQVLDQVVLGPLELSAECRFGISPADEPEIAWPTRAPDLLPPLPPRPTFWNPMENMLRLSAVRRACLPAFNCTASARSLAKLGGGLLEDFVPAELLAEAARLQRPANQPTPANPGYWEFFGYGFIIYAGGQCFGHGGYGGTELIIDRQRRTVLALTKNRLSTAQETRDKLRNLVLGISN